MKTEMAEMLSPWGAVKRPQVPFMLISGGKGGVGKTLVAANLAVRMSQNGHRVLLVDLDLGLADLHVMLRLPSGPNLEDALEGRASVEECIVEGPEGVHVLPAGSGTARMGRADAATRMRILEIISEAAEGYDLILADGAAGIGPDVLTFASVADHVWVVTTPQPAALTDAYGLIKALHTHGIESGREVPTPELIVNFASGLEEARSTARKLRSVCEEFLSRSPRMGGWLPASAAVERSVREQRPLTCSARNPLEANCLQQLSLRLRRFLKPGNAALGA